MKIVAISDLHLGRKSSRARDTRALASLFAGADVGIINGDGVDFGWTPRDEAFRWHRDLLRHANEVCGKAIWIRGNHDLPVEGPIFHREGDLVFTHGHALFDVPPGTPTYQGAFDAVHDWHLQRHSTHRHGGSISNLADRIAGGVMPLRLASRWEIGNPESMDLSLLKAAAGEGIRTVVMGHLHITGILPREDAMLYVTGAWTGRAPTTAFVYEDGAAGLHRVVHRGGSLELGEVIPPPVRGGSPILAAT